MKRKAPSRHVVTQLLTACRRRCCLCYYLSDLRVECSGQIAHLNRDPSDGRLENLVWLCLNHHDQYDSRTSQSKGLTEGEVKAWRDKLTQEFNKSAQVPPVVEGPSRGASLVAAEYKPDSRFAWARLAYNVDDNVFSLIEQKGFKQVASRRISAIMSVDKYDKEIALYFEVATPKAVVRITTDHAGGHSYRIVQQNDFWVKVKPTISPVRFRPLQSHEVLIEISV